MPEFPDLDRSYDQGLGAFQPQLLPLGLLGRAVRNFLRLRSLFVTDRALFHLVPSVEVSSLAACARDDCFVERVEFSVAAAPR